MAELKNRRTGGKNLLRDYEQLLDKYQFSAKEITPGKIIKGG